MHTRKSSDSWGATLVRLDWARTLEVTLGTRHCYSWKHEDITTEPGSIGAAHHYDDKRPATNDVVLATALPPHSYLRWKLLSR